MMTKMSGMNPAGRERAASDITMIGTRNGRMKKPAAGRAWKNNGPSFGMTDNTDGVRTDNARKRGRFIIMGRRLMFKSITCRRESNKSKNLFHRICKPFQCAVIFLPLSPLS